MQVFVDEAAFRHPEENILMVVDGGGWHRSQNLQMPSDLRLLFLPPYAPELDPVENLWDNLREKSFHNRVFNSITSLEIHPVQTLADSEQPPNGCAGFRTALDYYYCII